jgi:hypothetical protein
MKTARKDSLASIKLPKVNKIPNRFSIIKNLIKSEYSPLDTSTFIKYAKD